MGLFQKLFGAKPKKKQEPVKAEPITELETVKEEPVTEAEVVSEPAAVETEVVTEAPIEEVKPEETAPDAPATEEPATEAAVVEEKQEEKKPAPKKRAPAKKPAATKATEEKAEAEKAEEPAKEAPVEATAEESATPAKTSKSGRFEIKKAKDGRFVFNLYASNHVIVATSQIYSSSTSAVNGINSIIANAERAGVEDQTLKTFETVPFPKWEIYQDKGGQYRFRLSAPNGSCIVHSQGYTTKASCKNGIESIIKSVKNAEIDKAYLKKD